MIKGVQTLPQRDIEEAGGKKRKQGWEINGIVVKIDKTDREKYGKVGKIEKNETGKKREIRENRGNSVGR